MEFIIPVVLLVLGGYSPTTSTNTIELLPRLNSIQNELLELELLY
jgi:hypothetical protein